MGCYVIAKRKPGIDIFEFDNKQYEDIGDETCIFGNTEVAAREFEAAVAKEGRNNVMLLQIVNVDIKVHVCARIQDELGDVIYMHERYHE